MNEIFSHALNVIADRGQQLRTVWRLDWPDPIQQAVLRLRLGHHVRAGCLTTCAASPETGEPTGAFKELPLLAAVIGGASSGKSTLFNNLLGGHLASRITARGHATLGPILAVHENRRCPVQRLLHDGLLLPGLRRIHIDLDDNAVGQPDAVAIVFHTVNEFRDVLLADLPDFTSQDAQKEGDLAMRLLPWFDRILVVVDHERWFDRQSISQLRAQSVRFGQQRWALFNRTREDAMPEDGHTTLAQQARHLGAEGMSVLDFRRGRGFRLFPPGTLDEIPVFLSKPQPDRTPALLRAIAEAANRAANQNEERAARLDELRRSLDAVVNRTVPLARQCMTSLMTPPEREQLEVVARVLRISQTKRWAKHQAHRLQATLRRVPVLGSVIGATVPCDETAESDSVDRRTVATTYFEGVARRHANEIRRAVCGSAFWDEMHRWTGLEPAGHEFAWNPAMQEQVRSAADAFDAALTTWVDTVDSQCQGLSPSIKGAFGVGSVALLVVLIAAPGPVTALTLASAHGAIAAALVKLATASGAGAMLGKPIQRLTKLVEEQLLGTPEFDAVGQATAHFRSLLDAAGRRLAELALADASALVMDSHDPLVTALACLRNPPEVPR